MDAEIRDFETSTNVAPPTGESAAPSAGVGDTARSQPVTEPEQPQADAREPEAEASEDVAGTRDRKGRFRHRARSQQARPEDVPRIQELTRRLRERETEIETLRKAATPPAAAQTSTPVPAGVPAPVSQTGPASASIPQTFPTFDQFVAFEGNADKTYEEYVDARADWRYAIQRATERLRDAADKAHRDWTEKLTAHQARLADAKTKHPDWDTVVTDAVPLSRVLAEAILGSSESTEIQYYLGTHRDELAALVQESSDFHPSAVAPMRRYLEKLVVAPEQRASSSSRPVAAPTGSALALVPPPVPRPPNPVRTGAMKSGEELPGDESSLEEHEQAFGRRRRAHR